MVNATGPAAAITPAQRPPEAVNRSPAPEPSGRAADLPVDSTSIGVSAPADGAPASGLQSAVAAADVIHSNVLIIGSGPAGYTAAIYAARANRHPVMVSGMEPGGQLTSTTDVENYPGFTDPIAGPQLMDQMRAQAERMGTRIENDLITRVDLSQRPFVAIGDSGKKYTGDTVIVATGASAKWLGIPSEEHFRGAGVSACATCDGFFFRDKSVAVVGGGNTAVEDALYLSNFARSVTVIHRRDRFTAEKVLQDRLFANPRIHVVWNSAVEEIRGTEEPKLVTALHLRNLQTKQTSDLPVDGLFVAIGHKPASDVFKGQLNLSPEGYVVTSPGSTATSVPGVFAAGDVQDDKFRQAVVAAGTGCMSALEAEQFLMQHESEKAAP